MTSVIESDHDGAASESPPLLVHESQSIAHLSARTWKAPIITKVPIGLIISGV